MKKCRELLDAALEEINLLCDPVPSPKSQLDYHRYFCGNSELPNDLKDHEPQRTALYKLTVSLVRSFANIENELEEAGYNEAEILDIKEQVKFYVNLRDEVKKVSGETVDLKSYEADMRHLIDNYIEASDPTIISSFGDMTLLDIIENSGITEAINSLPKGVRANQEAVAEAIENNVRQKIIKEQLVDPAFYDEMSKLLNEIIKKRKDDAIKYAQYLKEIADLAKQVNIGKGNDLPVGLETNAQRALYNNLGRNEQQALIIDGAIRGVKKADFRGNLMKENEIKSAIYAILNDVDEVERIFAIVKQQSDY
jgi:type I restriction enzyme R subunit